VSIADQVVGGTVRTVNIVVPGSGLVTTTVRNGAGALLANAMVKVSSQPPLADYRTGKTDTSGAFQANIPAAPFSVLAVDPPSGMSGTATGTVARNGTANIDITLQSFQPGTVYGTVTFYGGTIPVANPNIFLTQPDSNGILQTYFPDSTDANGVYLFSGIPNGPFVITAQTDTGITTNQAGSVVNQTTPVRLTIVMPATGNVTTQVLDGSGNPVTARIGFSSVGLAFDAIGNTDSSGIYAFAAPIGPFFVQAVGFLGGPEDRTFVYLTKSGSISAPGDSRNVDLIASPPTGNGTLHLDVFLADGVTRPPRVRILMVSHDSDGAVGYGYPNGGDFFTSLPDFGVLPGNNDVYAQLLSATPGMLSDLVYPGLAGTTSVTTTAGTTTNATILLGSSGASIYNGANLDGSDGFRYDVGCDLSLMGAGTVDGRLTSAFLTGTSASFQSASGAGYTLAPGLPCRFSVGKLELNGRQIVAGPAPYVGLKVTRKIFVPTSGGFARYLEIFTNPTSDSYTIPVEASAILGSGTGTRVYTAPSATGNTYAVTDANLLCCTPALGHVFAGVNAAAPVSSFHAVSGDPSLTASWNITVPPGQTVILMHFAVQRDSADAAGAKTQAQSLADLTDPNALSGMTAAEKAQVVNFRIP
jgi:hypothetical protein